MSDEQKPVEVPAETAPAVEPVVEAPVVEETPAPAAEVAPVEEAAPAATEETTEAAAAPAEEAKKEEVKPVEEGSLEHKGQGANFPKNLIYSKKFFWFGEEPVDTKAATTFKADKVVDVAHHVASWAAETGKGLLFYSEKSDKTAPHGAIQLAEASEPVTEGSNKFHFTAKGHKHTFKATSAAERDNWVAQLKAKITEAKELVATVTDSETYKTTLASLKPAPPAKKEEVVAPVAEVEAPAVEEAPKAAEEPAKEEVKKEEPKRRSASRKRASIFGSLLGKKDEEKKVAETPVEVKAAEPEAPVVEEAAPVEIPAVAETAEVAPIAAEATEAVEEPKEEAKKEEKPVPTKRNSIFGNLGFGKKKVAEPVVEAPKEVTEPVAETAPVIPAVETTEPLTAEVVEAAAVPAETTEVTPAVNGEKKEAKAEKRKSSLPFTLGGKKEKPTSDDEGKKKESAFSKLRATIKGKKTEKPAEKAEEVPAVPEATETEAAKEAEPIAEEAPAAVEPEIVVPVVEDVPKPLETAPVVTAAA